MEAILKLSAPQLAVLCESIDTGVRSALERLDASGEMACVTAIKAVCCPLSAFPGEGLCDDEGDAMAGVAASFYGPLAGTTLLTMAPEHALAWIRSTPGGDDPLRTYVSLGRTVLRGGVHGLMHALQTEDQGELGAPSLVEDSVAGALLATHAPSDTALLSLALCVRMGDQSWPAYLYTLLDPKAFSSLLAGLRPFAS
ncbi:MAG: hypothetical protein MJE66_12915 [Proteobacteria bacterium]|nr:hypothetical protein [Pseudomonadota bacterium]